MIERLSIYGPPTQPLTALPLGAAATVAKSRFLPNTGGRLLEMVVGRTSVELVRFAPMGDRWNQGRGYHLTLAEARGGFDSGPPAGLKRINSKPKLQIPMTKEIPDSKLQNEAAAGWQLLPLRTGVFGDFGARWSLELGVGVFPLPVSRKANQSLPATHGYVALTGIRNCGKTTRLTR